jgi:hypothetical protein
MSRHYFDYLICTPGHTGTHTLEDCCTKEKIKWYGTHLLIDLTYALNQTNKTIITSFRNPIDRNYSKFIKEMKQPPLTGPREQFHHHKLFNYYGPCASEVMKMNKKQVNDLFDSIKWHYFEVEWMESFIKLTGIDISKFDNKKGMTIYELKNNNKLILLTTEKMSSNIDEIFSSKCKNVHSSKKKEDILHKKLINSLEYKEEYLRKNLNHPLMDFFYTEEDIKKFKQKYKLID